MDGILVFLACIAPFLMLLVVGGFLADYVLPRCPRLIRIMERLLDVDLKGGYDDE